MRRAPNFISRTVPCPAPGRASPSHGEEQILPDKEHSRRAGVLRPDQWLAANP
jgi:hypothetical protein